MDRDRRRRCMACAQRALLPCLVQLWRADLGCAAGVSYSAVVGRLVVVLHSLTCNLCLEGAKWDHKSGTAREEHSTILDTLLWAPVAPFMLCGRVRGQRLGRTLAGAGRLAKSFAKIPANEQVGQRRLFSGRPLSRPGVSGRLLVGQRSPACWSLFSGRPLSRPGVMAP